MSAVVPYQQPDFLSRMGMQPSAVTSPVVSPVQPVQPAGNQNPWGSVGRAGTEGQGGRWQTSTSFGGGDSGEQATRRDWVWDDPNLQGLHSTDSGGWGGGGQQGIGMAAGWDLYTDPNTGTEYYRIGDYNPHDDAQRRTGVNFEEGDITYDPKYGRLVPRSKVQFDTSDTGTWNILAPYVVSAMLGGAAGMHMMGADALAGAGASGAGAGTGAGAGGLGADALAPLVLDTTSAGSIVPTGAYAGAGTGFTGAGSAAAGAGAVAAGAGDTGSALSGVTGAGTGSANTGLVANGTASGFNTGNATLDSILSGGRTALNAANVVGGIRGVTGRGIGTQQGAQQAGRDAAAAADPFASQRGFYQDWLKQNFPSLISNDPEQIKKDPAYQFQLDQGVKAIDNSAAAGGMLFSGNRGLEQMKFGHGLASDFTQKQFVRNNAILSQLMGLSGANTGSPGQAAQSLLSGFTGATNLQGNALNQLLGTSGAGSIFDIIGGVASGAGDFWSWLTG